MKKAPSRTKCSPESVSQVITAAGVEFARHVNCVEETVFVAVVESEVTRSAIVEDLRLAFGTIQVDPREGTDEGWTCCAMPTCIVHLLTSEAAAYYKEALSPV